MKSKNKFTRHLSDIFAPVVEKMYSFFNELVNGTPTMPSVFSFNGKLDKNQCIITIMMIGFLSSPVYLIANTLLNYCWTVLIFYLIAACVQKRCRDFGSNGTGWILACSLTMIIDRAFCFVDIYAVDGLWRNIIRANLLVVLLIVVLLCSISSKPEIEKQTEEFRSPLLKRPLLYVGGVWILTIVATLTVNHFFGVSISQ